MHKSSFEILVEIITLSENLSFRCLPQLEDFLLKKVPKFGLGAHPLNGYNKSAPPRIKSTNFTVLQLSHFILVSLKRWKKSCTIEILRLFTVFVKAMIKKNSTPFQIGSPFGMWTNSRGRGGDYGSLSLHSLNESLKDPRNGQKHWNFVSRNSQIGHM